MCQDCRRVTENFQCLEATRIGNDGLPEGRGTVWQRLHLTRYGRDLRRAGGLFHPKAIEQRIEQTSPYRLGQNMLHPLQECLFLPLPLFVACINQDGAGGKPSLQSFNDPDPLNIPQLDVDYTSIKKGLSQEGFSLLHIPTMD